MNYTADECNLIESNADKCNLQIVTAISAYEYHWHLRFEAVKCDTAETFDLKQINAICSW